MNLFWFVIDRLLWFQPSILRNHMMICRVVIISFGFQTHVWCCTWLTSDYDLKLYQCNLGSIDFFHRLSFVPPCKLLFCISWPYYWNWSKSFNFISCYFQGFVTAVSHMRAFVPAVYDVTLVIPKSSPPPTMLRLFKGQPSVVSQLNLRT